MCTFSPFPFFILRGHEGNVSALRFCNEKDTALNFQPSLLSGSDIGEIFIWNLQSFRIIHRLMYSEKRPIMFLEYHKSKLLSQAKDGVIIIWNYTHNNWIAIREFKSNSVGFCASFFWVMENKAFITLYDQDKNALNIYDVDEEKQIKSLCSKTSPGMCMCLKVIKVKERLIVIAGFENGDIVLIDFESYSKIHSMNFHKEFVTCLDFDNQKEMRGISGSVDTFIKIWKINDKYELENVHQLDFKACGINDIKIREDKKIVLTAGWDSSIRIFSWKSLKFLISLPFHELSVQCLACSLLPVDNKKNVFASGSKDKNIALWDIY